MNIRPPPPNYRSGGATGVKARAKKQMAREKRETKLTGGGPSTLKEDDEAFADYLPPEVCIYEKSPT